MKLLSKAVLAILLLGGLAWYSSANSDSVTIPKAEYSQLQHDAKLLKEYKAMKRMREQALKDRSAKKYPSLFDTCGNALGPDGKVYDPQDWFDK